MKIIFLIEKKEIVNKWNPLGTLISLSKSDFLQIIFDEILRFENVSILIGDLSRSLKVEKILESN